MATTRKPIPNSEIVTAYLDEGLSFVACAARFSLSIGTIFRRLKEAGVKARPAHGPIGPNSPRLDGAPSSADDKAAYAKAWRSKNREHMREYNRRYKASVKERDAEKNRKKAAEWAAQNKERHAANAKRRYASKSEEIIQKTAANRKRRREADPEGFRAKDAAYVRQRRQTNLKFAVSSRMSNRVFYALRRNKEGRSWKTMVDYTLDELVERLNSTMPDGYTWDDFLSGALHIDHETPVAVFNFTSPSDHDFKRCWALSNLRLLPALENLKKGAKLRIPFQPALL